MFGLLFYEFDVEVNQALRSVLSNGCRGMVYAAANDRLPSFLSSIGPDAEPANASRRKEADSTSSRNFSSSSFNLSSFFPRLFINHHSILFVSLFLLLLLLLFVALIQTAAATITIMFTLYFFLLSIRILLFLAIVVVVRRALFFVSCALILLKTNQPLPPYSLEISDPPLVTLSRCFVFPFIRLITSR